MTRTYDRPPTIQFDIANNLWILEKHAGWLTDPVLLTAKDALALVSASWGFSVTSATPLSGAMNSACWDVHAGEGRWVLKVVPLRQADQFHAGLEAAAQLTEKGIAAGAPILTVQGGLTVPIPSGGAAALLTWVQGEPLVGDTARDHVAMARTLAAVHTALRASDIKHAEPFHWIDVEAYHLREPPWLSPAVRNAVAGVDALQARLTQGLLHGDPAPEAFRLDGDGRVGLIDWSAAVRGPLLYDVASAAMYLGGPATAEAFLETYAAHGPLLIEEITAHLAAMLEFRWAVQADYFAHRIATDDLTGIDSRRDNEQGLADARRGLGA